MVKVLESIGPYPGSEQEVTFVNLISQDGHSGGELGYLENPVRPNSDLSAGFSVERWVRFLFDPPFALISDLYFWIPDLIVPFGWTFKYGLTDTYQEPTSSESSYATLSIPDEKPIAPNIGGVPPIAGPSSYYTDWIVMQASVSGDAASGPIQGFDSLNRPIPFQYRLEWTQV
jgi:hypothetical protein